MHRTSQCNYDDDVILCCSTPHMHLSQQTFNILLLLAPQNESATVSDSSDSVIVFVDYDE